MEVLGARGRVEVWPRPAALQLVRLGVALLAHAAHPGPGGLGAARVGARVQRVAREPRELGEGRRLLGDLGRVHVRVPPGAADLLALRRRQPAPALRQRAGGEALRQPSDLRARHHDLRGDVVVQLALVGAIRQPPREHVDLAQLRGPAARLLQLVADVLHNRLVAVPALAVLTTRRLAATPARAPRQPQAQAPTRRGLGA
mmetsp:Transcript_71703/g.184946  ORF Transcript_71703/g.184946 Transcript_71703/m.184946 type:complete len:201 (-) Transcript_71703:267-869(-)